MKCPSCGNTEDRVLDTRVQKEGDIRRRRECLACKSRFTTIETVLLSYPHIIKKDGRREAFSKEKLRRGLQRACQKRPVSFAQIEHIVSRISKWILDRGEKEVRAADLGQAVVQALREVDDVAYVRFASVYKTFKDVNEFLESLESEKAAQNSAPGPK